MRNSKSILRFSNKYEDIQHHNLLIFTLLHSPVILRRNYSPDKAQRKKIKKLPMLQKQQQLQKVNSIRILKSWDYQPWFS